MGTPLCGKYIPYTYMDPLGRGLRLLAVYYIMIIYVGVMGGNIGNYLGFYSTAIRLGV